MPDTQEGGTNRQTRTVNGCEVFKKENRYGVEKDHVKVPIGTSVVEVPRRRLNPLTDRNHDLTKLSDDGYLKPFLALIYHESSADKIDIGSAPFLAFDKERWELVEGGPDGQHVLVKRDAESTFEEMVLESAGTQDTEMDR